MKKIHQCFIISQIIYSTVVFFFLQTFDANYQKLGCKAPIGGDILPSTNMSLTRRLSRSYGPPLSTCKLCFNICVNR